VEGYLDLGERYYLEKDYEKALQTYTEAVHYYSSDARILNNLGSVYLAMGQTGRAIHYYQESRNASKDFVEPVYNWLRICDPGRQGQGYLEPQACRLHEPGGKAVGRLRP
jgi:tetratricopeptide (TPR) repeat protein